MDIETTISIIVLALIILGACVTIYGTIVKNRWGINFRRLSCPNCGAQMPRVRTPASGRQFMWGGVTCPKCGCEMDKWGRKLTG